MEDPSLRADLATRRGQQTLSGTRDVETLRFDFDGAAIGAAVFADDVDVTSAWLASDFAGYQRPFDCNFNGIPDQCDIATGRSLDSDRDERLDECDPSPTSPARCRPFYML